MKSGKTPHDLSSRESLLSLDKEQLVDLVLLLNAKYMQAGEVVRDLVLSKYGKKTEHFENPDQLSIFPAADSQVPDEQEEPTEQAKQKDPAKKKSGHSRNPLPADLPRIPVRAELDSESSTCSHCGHPLEVVREILQGSRLQYVPASFHIEDLLAQVYCCPECRGDEIIARVKEPVQNGIAGAGLLAEVAVSKGTDHLPFNRQSNIYARSGVHLSRSTLADLFAHTSEILKPLYEYMHTEILKSKVVCTDDTPLKVQDRSKPKNIKTGRLWIYLGDTEHPFNLFDYTTGRGRDGPLSFLAGFGGFLQGDCFSGNLAVCAAAGIILVACIAHARRYFIKAILNDKNGCNHALTMFQSLYEIERTAKELGLKSPELKTMRQEESVPILNQMYDWLNQQFLIALPQSSFRKALFYCLNNWTELTQFVVDGCLTIDNNISEREMKYVDMGRRAWLFLGSDVGGKNHAVVLSILATCRRHGVEP